MPIQKTCEHCGAGYKVPPARAKSRFCCRACADEGQKTSERREITCECCGTKFLTAQDHGAWPRFCGRECFLKSCIRPEEKECAHCGSIFTATRTSTGQTDDGRRIYCSKKCADEGKRKSTERQCLECGTTFYPLNVAQNDDQCTCSVECRIAYFRGARSPAFKGGSYIDATTGNRNVLLPRPGYVGKYIGAHRLAAAKAIGRPLQRGEVVIHINRGEKSERPEDLFICATMSEFGRRRNGSLPWPTESNLATYEATKKASEGGGE